jgi:hypothetical protein
MSTPSQQSADELAQEIKNIRMERFLSGLLRGGLTWLSISLALWAVLVLLDVTLALPAEIRFPTALLAVGATGWLFYTHVVSAMHRFYSLDRAAYELEQEYDIPRNMLINAYQLSRQDLTEDESKLAEKTVQKAKVWSQRLREADTWEVGTLLKTGCFALLVLFFWGGALASAPGVIGNSLMRFSLPHSDVPPAGRVQLQVVPARNVTLQRGSDHRVLLFVKTRNHEGNKRDKLLEHRPRIVVKQDAGDVSTSRATAGEGVRMSSVPEKRVDELLAEVRGTETVNSNGAGSGSSPDRSVYEYRFKNLRKPRAFRIFHGPGRTHTRSYRINLRSIPQLTESRFRIKPPEYTGNDWDEQPGPPDSLKALPGSKVGIEIKLDTHVDELVWRGAGKEKSFSQADDRLWQLITRIRDTGSYEVVSKRKEKGKDGKNELISQVVASGNVLARPDETPHVTFNTDRMNRELWPGQSLDLEIEAEDDFGVSDIALTVQQTGGDNGNGRELMSWDLDGPPGNTDPKPVRHTVQLDPSNFSPGKEYVFRARATDFHPDKQTSRSNPLLVKVKKMDDLSEVDESSTALELLTKAIEQQRRALSNTRTVSNYMDAVIGEDPDHPEFTFDNHRVRLEARQSRVNRLLNKMSDRTPDEMKKFAKKALTVRKELVHPLATEIRGYAGNPKPWFHENALVTSDQQYSDDGKGWHQVRIPARKAQYVGLRMKSFNGRFSMSDFEFLDADGVAIPPPYVNRFRVAPVHKKWDGPVGFVKLQKNELNAIVSKALKTDLRGGGGPVVSMKGLVEDAPDKGVTLYAVRVINTEKPRRVLMYAGSSDSLRIWLNGADNLQLKKLARRKPKPNSNRTELKLKKGENILVAEVSADKRPPALAMRFETPDGKRLSLTENGRLVRAPDKRIIHAGASPGHASRVIDENSGSAWKVKKNSPVMLIVDAGGNRKLGGVRFRVPGKTSNRKNGVGTYDLFAAADLRIQNELPSRVTSIEKRQSNAVDRLVQIRTNWIEYEEERERNVAEKDEENPFEEDEDGPSLSAGKKYEDLVNNLLEQSKESLELSKERKSVLDKSGEDLSDEEREKLEEIKNAEKKKARKMRDIVQDMSQIGNQNLSNSVQRKSAQELVKKSDELADKNEEVADKDISQITDNLDTATQDLNEEIEKQSRLAFGDGGPSQDMVETAEDKQTPIPEAELPQTLNDLVGEMEEDFQEPDESKQTVGSMLKSLDTSGPISPGRQSSYTAKGKTGKQPPDAMRELEGRSGFGRTGRASGQGAANVAKDIPQDDMVPPNRNTGTSLEQGSVTDKSDEARAGGTGLGKETNRTGQFGMEGELPDTLLDRMRKTAGKTTKMRENMAGVATQLGRHNLSTKQLREAMQALKQVEKAADAGNYVQFRRAYEKAMQKVIESETVVSQQVGKRVIRKRAESDAERPQNSRDATVPEGYTEMVSEYFRAIAEEQKEQ